MHNKKKTCIWYRVRINSVSEWMNSVSKWSNSVSKCIIKKRLDTRLIHLDTELIYPLWYIYKYTYTAEYKNNRILCYQFSILYNLPDKIRLPVSGDSNDIFSESL